MTYPLAKQGVFATIQGEGSLLGVPMTFVRLAGCSVGCPLCDTDYAVSEKVSLDELADRVQSLGGRNEWIWITGGEPADHDLFPLVERLKLFGRVAVATSGHKSLGTALPDFLSVSPHDPRSWKIRSGSEIKLVPGLNGFGLADFEPYLPGISFGRRYVSPLAGNAESVGECVRWVQDHPSWLMMTQAHKAWGMP